MTNNLGRWTFFAIIGVVLQGFGIGMFSLMSRSEWSLTGKPMVLVFTASAMILLLWLFLNKRRKAIAIPVAATCLAVGYVAAFHIVGVTAFPGFLRDISDEGYVVKAFRVFSVVLVLYAACAVVLMGSARSIRRVLRHLCQPK